MEATTIISAGTILALGLVFFALSFWYGKSFSRVLKPVAEVYEAAGMHATVYAAEIKVAAIAKAAKLEINPDNLAIAKQKLGLVNGFNFDVERPVEVIVEESK